MNYLDLFSGIGGFALRARMADIKFTSHHFSEIEPYAIKVYEKNFPNAISQGDITKINGQELIDNYGKNWCITVGFPCQDLSAAGARQGLEGARSGLWFQMLRAIRELPPNIIIIENVPQLLSSGFEQVICPLSELGLDAEWAIIPVSAIGGCHVRKRCWVDYSNWSSH